MKFHLDSTAQALRITGYGPGYVRVGERQVAANCVISSNGVHAPVEIGGPDELSWSALEFLHQTPPDILLLGTGTEQQFPPPALYRELAALNIGLEAMSTPAACRTFNILLAEGRNVAALLLMR